MDRDVIRKAVLIPVLTGLITGVLFTVAFSQRIAGTMPFNEGAQLAVHQQLTLDEGEDAATVKEAAKNACIGAAINGRELVKDADYTLLKECISVQTGSNEFNGAGCRYLKTLNGLAGEFSDSLTVVHRDGTQQFFVLTEEYTVNNEREALAVAPSADSSLVVYYQDREGVGLSSAYHVMIYEEVA